MGWLAQSRPCGPRAYLSKLCLVWLWYLRTCIRFSLCKSSLGSDEEEEEEEEVEIDMVIMEVGIKVLVLVVRNLSAEVVEGKKWQK